jgi:hypothetical protein
VLHIVSVSPVLPALLAVTPPTGLRKSFMARAKALAVISIDKE